MGVCDESWLSHGVFHLWPWTWPRFCLPYRNKGRTRGREKKPSGSISYLLGLTLPKRPKRFTFWSCAGEERDSGEKRGFCSQPGRVLTLAPWPTFERLPGGLDKGKWACVMARGRERRHQGECSHFCQGNCLPMKS